MNPQSAIKNRKSLCIVGLGLMGASLALAVRSKYSRITAVTRRPETADEALKRNIVDAASTDFNAIQDADIVVLAAPVRTIIQQLENLRFFENLRFCVTDLGSTKTEIVKAMDALPATMRAVGSHPMCGKEVTGLDAADATLYRNRTWVLTRTERTDDESFATIKALAEHAGANTLELDAQRHDQLVAWISHLPYAVSAALMSTVDEASLNDDAVYRVAASGFRDTTRIAGSDVNMMLDILMTNRDAVLNSARDFQFTLDQFTALLERRDEAGLRAFLASSAKARGDYMRRGESEKAGK
jgi:prephenate dehydrogenase